MASVRLTNKVKDEITATINRDFTFLIDEVRDHEGLEATLVAIVAARVNSAVDTMNEHIKTVQQAAVDAAPAALNQEGRDELRDGVSTALQTRVYSGVKIALKHIEHGVSEHGVQTEKVLSLYSTTYKHALGSWHLPSWVDVAEVGDVWDEALASTVLPAYKKREELRAQRTAAMKYARDMMETATTLKALMVMWPDVLNLVDEDTLALHRERPKPRVPKLVDETLDAADVVDTSVAESMRNATARATSIRALKQ